MNKSALTGALLLGWAVSACSSIGYSISHEERLAVHFGVRGEMHTRLNALEGRFEVTSHYWPDPNDAPLRSTGVMVGSWGDRGLCMSNEYDGELLNHESRLTTAITWDDVRGCYVGIWTDDDDRTVMVLGDGHLDEIGAIVTVRRADETFVREVLLVLSPEEHVRDIYRKDAHGQEYLSLSLHMVRTDS